MKKNRTRKELSFTLENDQWILISETTSIYDDQNFIILTEHTDHLYSDRCYKSVYEYKNNRQILQEHYQGKNDEDEWIKISKKIWEYNDKGWQTLFESFIANKSNKWITEVKYIYTFDEEYKYITNETYNYSNNRITNASKSERIWKDGEIKERIVSYYYNGKWEVDGKYIYSYNNDGDLISADFYSYYSDGSWYKNATNEYTYDERHNEILQEHHYWSNNKWVKGNRYAYDYDDNNNMILFESHQGVNNEWVAKVKQVWKFYENNLRYQTLYEYYIGGRDNEWLKSQKKVWEYDDRYNEILYENYTDGDENTWKKDQKKINQYNENNDLSIVELHYGDEENQWKYIIKSTYEYDEDNLRISIIYHIGNENNEWIYDGYNLCYYSEQVISGNEFPLLNSEPIVTLLDGILYINTPNTEEIITIYSPSGKIIYSGNSKRFPSAVLPRGMIIVKGNSGWVKKTIN